MSKLTFRVRSYCEAIKAMRCASSGEVKSSGIPWVGLFAILILFAILLAAIPNVAGQCSGPNFCYTGYSEATGASATLTFEISGTTVINGKLGASDVCKDNVGITQYTAHLPGTDIKFTGTVVGGTWEGPATTIVGTWTGGETKPCSGGIITNDPAFPNAGTLRIWLTPNNEVHLNRNLPRGLDFIFGSTGRAYIPSGAGPGGTGPGGILTAPPGAEYEILDYAICRNVKDEEPVDRTNMFSTEDELAYYWIKIGPHEHAHTFTTKLYSPDGELYEEIAPSTSEDKYSDSWSYWGWMHIKGQKPENMPGTWSVETYLDDQYIGTQQFTIGGVALVQVG